MTRPNPSPSAVLAVSPDGWRIIRKDQKKRAVWFLFTVISADGLLKYRGACDGTKWGDGKDLMHLRRFEPATFAWVATILRTLWDSGLR
jgi:hypothetical protein